jgi:CrcB protein
MGTGEGGYLTSGLRAGSHRGRRERTIPAEMAALPYHFYLLVAFGSGLGGAARLYVSTLVARGLGTGFPWGTLAVNVFGCVVVGALGALFEPASPLHVRQDLRVLLIVGFLGGFTTFSAFSLEALLLAQRGEVGAAVSYVAASVVCCLLAAWASYSAASYALR